MIKPNGQKCDQQTNGQKTIEVYNNSAVIIDEC